MPSGSRADFTHNASSASIPSGVNSDQPISGFGLAGPPASQPPPASVPENDAGFFRVLRVFPDQSRKACRARVLECRPERAQFLLDLRLRLALDHPARGQPEAEIENQQAGHEDPGEAQGQPERGRSDDILPDLTEARR